MTTHDVNLVGRHHEFDGTQRPNGVVGAELMITKASVDPNTGEMRWAAVTSDTERDLYNERMTVPLYKSFVRRIADKTPVPPPLSSEFWNGGLPYVSISHYLDLNGKGAAGMAREVYIDGTLLKAKGVFENKQNPALARAAAMAVKADIQAGLPTDKRIRISIAFIDWSHTHADGSSYTRKSITDPCPICEQGVPISEYVDGHLIHLGLTRVPVNPRSSIALEERSMTTKKEDATSIVGEALAEELDTESKSAVAAKSLVVKSDDADADDAHGDSDPSGTANSGMMMDSMAQLAEVVARAQTILSQLQGVQPMSNQQPAAETLVVNPPATVQAHPLDGVFAALRASYDQAVDPTNTADRKTKLASLQAPVNQLGQAITRAIDTATPINTSDIETVVRAQVDAAVQPLLQQLAGLQSTLGVRTQATTPVQGAPAPRQIQPATVARSEAETPQASTSVIKQLVRKSVLGARA